MKTKVPGSGRKKGTGNKITRELREMVLQALDEAGGVSYLVDVAKSNPVAFLALLSKILPTTVAGDTNNPIHTVQHGLSHFYGGMLPDNTESCEVAPN